MNCAVKLSFSIVIYSYHFNCETRAITMATSFAHTIKKIYICFRTIDILHKSQMYTLTFLAANLRNLVDDDFY